METVRPGPRCATCSTETPSVSRSTTCWPTAGAFSTYIQFNYWGGISFQIASGDTITKDGEAMIGRGVMPDYVVDQKQSDLLAGVDTIHEAALAWVRQELKP